MRLHSLSLNGQFKLLSGTPGKPFEVHFSRSSSDRSPICLVGLNGSGKSSLMELIADAFGYAERLSNGSFQVRADLPYSVTLEYSLADGETTTRVRLTCERKRATAWVKQGAEWREVSTSDHVPRVVAYSSGGNQALSTVFARGQYAYFDVISRQGRFVRNFQSLYSRITGREADADERAADAVRTFLKSQHSRFPHLFADPSAYNPELDADEGLVTKQPALPRGIFSSHDTSQFTFIAAWLVGRDEFRRFLSDRIGVTRLQSFELDLRLSSFTEIDWVSESVDQLVQLASDRSRYDHSRLQGVLRFTLDEQFHAKFDEAFRTSKKRFFELLQFFFLLAGKRWSRDETAVLGTARYVRNVPVPAAGYAPLRLRNVTVELSSGAISLYDRLSDGEHQLVQIAGALTLFGDENTLFILDEPESHLNPVWRAEFVEMISQLLLQSSADVLISTHSPFVVSGCKREHVLKFSKQDHRVSIERPAEETYGASFDYLLNALFDMRALIASKPADELKKIIARGNPNELSVAAKSFGGSMEKAALFERLSSSHKQRG